tara:strand:- start:1923 stop:2096 length:174 start_codon:yes stop_codon:yes gene_type:complete
MEKHNCSKSDIAYILGFPQIQKEKRKNTWYVNPKSVDQNIDYINQHKKKKTTRAKYW